MNNRTAAALRIARSLGLDVKSATWLFLGETQANVLLTFATLTERNAAMVHLVGRKVPGMLRFSRGVSATVLSVIFDVSTVEACTA